MNPQLMKFGVTTPLPLKAGERWSAKDTYRLGWLLFFGVVLRVVFFTGFYGSDEVTYTEVARSIADGAVPRSTYIGAIRYGVNFPVAFFLKVFGASEFSANLWSLVTSTGEIALVYVAAKLMWGTRAAVISALILALLPVHIHYAGRLMADAPLGFFITATFLAFWRAHKKDTSGSYLLAGCAAGAIFWIKDSVFYLSVAVLVLCILCARCWNMRLGWSIAGALAVVAMNCLTMWTLYDDPFYLYVVAAQSVRILPGTSTTTPSFYLTYMLFNIRHTGILIYLALCAAFMMVKRPAVLQTLKEPEGFVLIWAGGLIFALSLLPLRQVNYMLIFTAPLALLAGFALSKMKFSAVLPLLIIVVLTGVIFSAFQQQAAQSFTANSRSSITFADSHPDSVIFGTTGALRGDTYQIAVSTQRSARLPLLSLASLDRLLGGHVSPADHAVLSRATHAYAVMDPQTEGWGDPGDGNWTARRISPCLINGTPLAPAPLGFGRRIVNGLLQVTSILPSKLAEPVSAKLRISLQPQVATVFQVVSPCFPATS
jgi:hypothetical protein